MKKFVLILLLFFTKSLVSGKDLYVKQGNSNSNNGLTPATAVGITPTGSFPNAFLTTVQPGDVIHLIGTFTNPSYSTTITMSTPVDDPRFWHGENTLRINNLNGAAGNYITIKAYDSNTLLKGDGGNIFRIQNSSYLKIEGFDIQGEVDNLPLALANKLQFVYVISSSDVTDPTPAQIRYRDQDCVSNCTAGAVVDGEVYTSINPNQVYRPTYYDTRAMYLSDVHHIDILNNHMHHMPGGGLRVSDCEDILIQGNEINDCSRRSSGGTHGLVVTKATSTRTTDDYRIRIIANKVHHNYNEQYSWAPDKTIITPHIDEGKGISLQRNQTVTGVNWNNGRILIANNICYYNGFSGIHSNDGFRIDIINNSCYFNSYTGSITIGGTNPNGGNIGISLQGGTGHKIVNNICVIDNNMTRSPLSTDITTVGGVIVRNNVIYGTTGSVGTDPDIDAVQINTQMANPQFKNPSLNEFDLLSTSPAINQADASYATTIPELTKDYYGNTRTTPDIGAIEYISSVMPVELLDFSLVPQQTAIHLFWQTASEKNNKGFDIERSKEGVSWHKIGTVKGNNNTKTLQKYAFVDSEPLQGVNYYRLKQVDTEGPFSYSKILSATIKTKNTVLAYPNPFTQNLWIEGVIQGDMIQIFDAVGRQVSAAKVATTVDNRLEINTSFLSPHSLYFLKIGEQVTKIVKN
jgi:hypothetical protein